VAKRGRDQDVLDWLTDWMERPDPATARANGKASATANATEERSDEEIIEKCREAKNAEKFEYLFDHGDTWHFHGGDDSRADMALMSIFAFYTQDHSQLARLFSQSALGRRSKWRDRDDYRERTIRNAVKNLRETYDWRRQKSRPRVSSSPDSPIEDGDDDETERIRSQPKIEWFYELGEPTEREYVIEHVGVKGYPIVAFGAGGVAKSYAVLAAGIGIASASGVDKWLGLKILEHGHVLYMDFELDRGEQHRRVRDLCNGRGVPVPKRLAYLSGYGQSIGATFAAAYKFVEDYEPVAVIVDSIGVAMIGDQDRAADVNKYYKRFIEPFRNKRVTPFLVDHEGKRQAGEKHRDKTPIGSVYKTNNSRSVLQFILDEYDEENSALDIRVHQSKTNFQPVDPFGVRITFEHHKVSIEPRELPTEELMDEERLLVRERILAALKLGPQTVPDLEKHTGATQGTLHNKLSELKAAGKVAHTGYQGRKKVYELVTRKEDETPPKGRDFSEARSHHHRTPLGETDDDENKSEAQARSSENKDAQTSGPMLQDDLPFPAPQNGRCVVHVKDRPDGLYTGRMVQHGGPHYFSNPFKMPQDGDRPEVLAKYEPYLDGLLDTHAGDRRLDVVERVTDGGRPLTCHCAGEEGIPKILRPWDKVFCHAQLLLRAIDLRRVRRLFAAPPGWLAPQIGLYRSDPDRHFRSLCAAVAEEALGDARLCENIMGEVLRQLEG
jgi:hypothetical protein